MLPVDGSSSPFLPPAFLRRALSPDGQVRLVTVDLTPLLQKLLEDCKLFPPSTVHVGQAAMGALMLQALSDTGDEDKIECQWKCAGPFGGLYADALGTGKIRVSIAHPRVEIPSLKEGLGLGLFQVRKVRVHQESSTGIVESSGHVGEDITRFLEQSEQRKTGVNLSVKLKSREAHGDEFPFYVERAVGYLIDVLGNLNFEQQQSTLQWWQAQMDVLGSPSDWALDENPEIATLEMLRMLTMKEHLQLTLEKPVELFCTCSQDKAIAAVKLLSLPEQLELIEESSEGIAIHCEYCGADYSVTLSNLAVAGS